MNGAKDFLKQQGILPRISFKDMLEHIITLKDSELKTIPDPQTGEPLKGVQFVAIENGEDRQFFTTSYQLIQGLAQLAEGTMVKVKMVKSKNQQGQFRTGYDITVVGKIPEGKTMGVPIKDEDIPVIPE